MKALTAHRLREGLNALVRPAPDLGAGGRARSPTTGTRASPASAGAISTGSSTAGRRRRSTPGACGTSPSPLDVEAMREGAAHARRPPRFHHLPLGPMPVGQPGEDARPAGRQPRRRGDPHRGGGAQLPPPPGALDGRLPGAGRARAMAAGGHAARRSRRATARRSASTRRRTGCISSKRSTPKRAFRAPAGGFPTPAGWRSGRRRRRRRWRSGRRARRAGASTSSPSTSNGVARQPVTVTCSSLGASKRLATAIG